MNKNIEYYEKYIKYKIKYLNLKGSGKDFINNIDINSISKYKINESNFFLLEFKDKEIYFTFNNILNRYDGNIKNENIIIKYNINNNLEYVKLYFLKNLLKNVDLLNINLERENINIKNIKFLLKIKNIHCKISIDNQDYYLFYINNIFYYGIDNKNDLQIPLEKLEKNLIFNNKILDNVSFYIHNDNNHIKYILDKSLLNLS